MSPGRKSLMSIGGGLSLLCCDSCKWEMDFKVVLSPFDRKIYFGALFMALLTFESRGVRLVLFEPAEKSCTKQIHLQAENHTWKVALLGIFLKWDILAPLTLTFTFSPPASPFSVLSQHW